MVRGVDWLTLTEMLPPVRRAMLRIQDGALRKVFTATGGSEKKKIRNISSKILDVFWEVDFSKLQVILKYQLQA